MCAKQRGACKSHLFEGRKSIRVFGDVKSVLGQIKCLFEYFIIIPCGEGGGGCQARITVKFIGLCVSQL